MICRRSAHLRCIVQACLDVNTTAATDKAFGNANYLKAIHHVTNINAAVGPVPLTAVASLVLAVSPVIATGEPPSPDEIRQCVSVVKEAQEAGADSPDILRLVRTPHKLGRLLIKPSYRKGTPDSHSVDTPYLFWHEGRYRMFHNCYDGIGYRTILASSDNLIDWERDGLVVDRGPPGSPTEFNAHITSVLRDSELYGRGDARLVEGQLLGTWQAYPNEGREQGRGVIGIARGQGLRDWEFGPVVLRPEDGAAWERGGLYKPCLVERAGRFYIFYNAKNQLNWPWHEQMGVAWSTDLKHWTRPHENPVVPNGGPDSPDGLFCADPCVLRQNNTWVMFYFGLARDLHARELVAFSDDLLHWRKANEVLIDVGPAGSIDAQYAHKPGVIAKDGVLYHFYAASRKKGPEDIDEVNAKDRRGITVATSEPLPSS